MLTTSIEEIKGHPKGPAYHLDFVDPQCHNGRSLSYRLPVTRDGLLAVKEAIDLLLDAMGTDHGKPVRLSRVRVQENADYPVVLYPNPKGGV